MLAYFCQHLGLDSISPELFRVPLPLHLPSPVNPGVPPPGAHLAGTTSTRNGARTAPPGDDELGSSIVHFCFRALSIFVFRNGARTAFPGDDGLSPADYVPAIMYVFMYVCMMRACMCVAPARIFLKKKMDKFLKKKMDKHTYMRACMCVAPARIYARRRHGA